MRATSLLSLLALGFVSFSRLARGAPPEAHEAPRISPLPPPGAPKVTAEPPPETLKPEEAKAAEKEEQQQCKKKEPATAAIAPRDPLEGRRSPPTQADVVPSPAGFAIGLRTGWAIPQGALSSGSELADAVVGTVPLWFDLGYRISEELLFGMYATYAFALSRSCPPDSSSCSASDVRFGLQAQYHFGPRNTLDHWVGLGAGFEIYDENFSGQSRRISGFEIANFQLGEDISLGRRFGLGPFVSVSIDEFTGVQTTQGITLPNDADLPRRALHLWTVIGVRFSFGA